MSKKCLVMEAASKTFLTLDTECFQRNRCGGFMDVKFIFVPYSVCFTDGVINSQCLLWPPAVVSRKYIRGHFYIAHSFFYDNPPYSTLNSCRLHWLCVILLAMINCYSRSTERALSGSRIVVNGQHGCIVERWE